MTFVIPTEQRVLTPQEYASLGYVQRGELPKELTTTPDAPLPTKLNIPVYRAQEKEQYYIDLGVGLVKVGYAFATGGAGVAGQRALGYTISILT